MYKKNALPLTTTEAEKGDPLGLKGALCIMSFFFFTKSDVEFKEVLFSREPATINVKCPALVKAVVFLRNSV